MPHRRQPTRRTAGRFACTHDFDITLAVFFCRSLPPNAGAASRGIPSRFFCFFLTVLGRRSSGVLKRAYFWGCCCSKLGPFLACTVTRRHCFGPSHACSPALHHAPTRPAWYALLSTHTAWVLIGAWDAVPNVGASGTPTRTGGRWGMRTMFFFVFFF